jgi:hypothetical protein
MPRKGKEYGREIDRMTLNSRAEHPPPPPTLNPGLLYNSDADDSTSLCAIGYTADQINFRATYTTEITSPTGVGVMVNLTDKGQVHVRVHRVERKRPHIW